MRVRALFSHFSGDGALHEAGTVYELAGDELTLRLKDCIVSDASAAVLPIPTPAQVLAAGRETVRDVSAARVDPPADPEE
jgi:hypothetical protein